MPIFDMAGAILLQLSITSHSPLSTGGFLKAASLRELPLPCSVIYRSSYSPDATLLSTFGVTFLVISASLFWSCSNCHRSYLFCQISHISGVVQGKATASFSAMTGLIEALQFTSLDRAGRVTFRLAANCVTVMSPINSVNISLGWGGLYIFFI